MIDHIKRIVDLSVNRPVYPSDKIVFPEIVKQTDFDNLNFGIWLGENSMSTISGATITGQANSLDGNITVQSPDLVSNIPVTDIDYNNGLDLNLGQRNVILPDSSIYENSASNARMLFLSVFELNTIPDFQYSFICSKYPESVNNSYDCFIDNNKKIHFTAYTGSSSAPYAIRIDTDKVLDLNTKYKLGIIFDLFNENIEFILNDEILTYSFLNISSTFTSIADFKTAGGIGNSTDSLALGSSSSDDVTSNVSYLRGKLFRYAQKAYATSDTMPTSTQILEMFSRMK